MKKGCHAEPRSTRRAASLLLPALASLAMMGCAQHGKVFLTDFEPVDDNHFRFSAKTEMETYTLESPAAEKQRLEWLSEYLAERKLCPDGHRVTDRQAVKQAEHWFGDAYTIYYQGECISTAS